MYCNVLIASLNSHVSLLLQLSNYDIYYSFAIFSIFRFRNLLEDDIIVKIILVSHVAYMRHLAHAAYMRRVINYIS